MNNTFIKKFFEGISRNRNYSSFWLINTIGWILFIAVDTFVVSPDAVLKNWHTFIDNTLQWLTGYVITIGLRTVSGC